MSWTSFIRWVKKKKARIPGKAKDGNRRGMPGRRKAANGCRGDVKRDGKERFRGRIEENGGFGEA